MLTTLWITAGLLIAIGAALIVVANKKNEGTYGYAGVGALAVGIVLLVVVGWMQAMPNYRLWRATIEKRILVEQARAEADAAIELARAEVERARGTAEANLIVAESITEPYLRYLFINGLESSENQIVYLPTEAGLPILEADRFDQQQGEGE